MEVYLVVVVVEDVDATECSERTLSRLDVRLNVDVLGVVEATAIGICDGLCFGIT